MSMGQEFRNHWIKLGLDGGKKFGRIDGMGESYARMVDSYVILVRKVMSERDISLDYAMSFVPEEIVYEVRSCIEGGQNLCGGTFMGMDEEFKEHWMKVGFGEGWIIGRMIGLEEAKEERMKRFMDQLHYDMVRGYTNTVRTAMSEYDFSLEQVM